MHLVRDVRDGGEPIRLHIESIDSPAQVLVDDGHLFGEDTVQLVTEVGGV